MTDSDLSTDRRFGRKYRLKGRTDFLEVIRGSETSRLKGEYCRLAATLSKSGESRFGISVSSKAGNSVKRNRIKRVLRGYLRENKDQWPVEKMVVISVDRPCGDEKKLLSEIQRLLQKIK